jgi:2'-5' RNA ligase
MHLESSLDIHVPEAEALLNPWRQRYHECAAFGAPAHITLFYPFVPPAQITPTLLEGLRLFFSTIPSFHFTLAHLGQFPEAPVLYLAPEPAEPICALIDLLAHRYPDTPPYGGAFEKATPHVTIARSAEPEVIQAITETFSHLEPITITLQETYLMTQQGDRHWHIHARFPLAR